MIRFFKRLDWIVRRKRREAEISEELTFHLREDANERADDGASTIDTRRAARLAFGNPTVIREDTRAAWIPRVVDRIAQDARYALRRMRQAPVFTGVAIASLALGIGANTAVFTLFNEVLLRPLPVSDPSALVNLAAPGEKGGNVSCNGSGGCDTVFSYPMFRDLERAQASFTGLAAQDPFRANLAFAGHTLNGHGTYVSGGYFPVLGLTPAAGRLIGPGDDRTPGESAVAVLAYDYWVERFAAGDDVVGQTMAVNGQAMTIVGVAPRGFTGTSVGVRTDVFVPITMRGQLEPPFDDFSNRRSYWVYLFARLKPGVSIDQARAAMNGQYQSILSAVDAPLQTGLDAAKLAAFKARPLTMESGARGQSILHQQAGTPIALLFAVTGIVLVIACANLANLLLARTASRQAELAVRGSIGASRGRLVSQLLVEALALSLAGGAAGLVLGEWLLTLGVSALTPLGFPPLAVHLDARLLAFALALSVVTGVVFSIFPALHGTRINFTSALKRHAARSTASRSAARFRASMILAQMILSTALLASAGLLIGSLVNVSRVDVGMRIDHLMAFTISPRLNGYTPAATRDFFERLEAALGATPGVDAASVSTVAFVADNMVGTSAAVEGAPKPARDSAAYSQIGTEFFDALGVPLVAGRPFTEADASGAPKVAIVNETFARRFAPGMNIVGRRGRFSASDHGPFDTEIVGVARDMKFQDVKSDVPPVFYTPYRQNGRLGGATLYVRTAVDPDTMLRTIPKVVASLDPNLPLEELRTMADQVRVNESGDRIITTLATSFALLATLLAAIGLYGVLAYTVAERTREFGVRIAIGASPRQLRRLVLAGVVRLTAIGTLAGAGLALVVGHYLQALLYQMKGTDPAAFVGAVATLTTVALAAGFVPAWRASRVDPMKALRTE